MVLFGVGQYDPAGHFWISVDFCGQYVASPSISTTGHSISCVGLGQYDPAAQVAGVVAFWTQTVPNAHVIASEGLGQYDPSGHPLGAVEFSTQYSPAEHATCTDGSSQ